MKSLLVLALSIITVQSFADNNTSYNSNSYDVCREANKYPGLCEHYPECALVEVRGQCTHLGQGQDWCKFQNNERSCNNVSSLQDCRWVPGGNLCVRRGGR